MDGQNAQVSLKEFLEQYPETDFFQVFPRLVLAEELPDYISFALEILKVAPAPLSERDEDERNDTYWIEEPWVEKGVVKDPGYLELTATALNRLAVAMGIQWSYAKRIDDGRDPLYCEYEACGVLPNITGARPEIQTYGLNLGVRRRMKEKKLWAYPPRGGRLKTGTWKDWAAASEADRKEIVEGLVEDYTLQMQDVIVQRAATGARNRVIRALSGLPRKYRPAVLQKKPFAVLKVIYAPRAKTTEERMHLHELMAGVYGRIYPTQPGRELGAGRREIPALPAGNELQIGPGEAVEILEETEHPRPGASQEPVAVGGAQEVGGGGDRPPAPKPGAAIPAESSQAGSAADDPFIVKIHELHRRLEEATGPKTAGEFLRSLVRHHKVKRLQDLPPGCSDRRAVEAAYEVRVEQEENNKAGLPSPGEPSGASPQLSVPPNHAAGSPANTPRPSRWSGKRYQMIIELRYANLKKQTPEGLMDVINTYTAASRERPGGYDYKLDPAAVMELLRSDSPTQEDLLEAAIRLVEWGLIQSTEKGRD